MGMATGVVRERLVYPPIGRYLCALELEKSGGGYGHEGLGVYGIYQERAAREKVRLAARLLEKAGLEVRVRVKIT